MCPTIEPGDLIFVDASINQFDGDGIYVFGFDDKIYVKRLQMIPDKLLVISDNQIYREWGIMQPKTNTDSWSLEGLNQSVANP